VISSVIFSSWPQSEDEVSDDLSTQEPLAAWAQINVNLQAMAGNSPVNNVDLFGLAACKIDGNRVTVHKNDADHWPSQPHGHIYDKNQVVNTEGQIFNKTTRQAVGRFSRAGLARWKSFLGNLRAVVITPLFNLMENLEADTDRARRAKENGKTIEQQRREDLRDQPTIPGIFGEPLPNPYYCPMAFNSINKGSATTNAAPYGYFAGFKWAENLSSSNLICSAQDSKITARVLNLSTLKH
jgi:hypothetical protein